MWHIQFILIWFNFHGSLMYNLIGVFSSSSPCNFHSWILVRIKCTTPIHSRIHFCAIQMGVQIAIQFNFINLHSAKLSSFVDDVCVRGAIGAKSHKNVQSIFSPSSSTRQISRSPERAQCTEATNWFSRFLRSAKRVDTEKKNNTQNPSACSTELQLKYFTTIATDDFSLSCRSRN